MLDSQSNDNLNIRIKGVGPDIVNVSWNGNQFLKNGIRLVRLVAEPSRMPSVIADAIINASVSSGSIVNGLMPSTRYMVYLVEISSSNKTHLIHYVTTSKGGEFTRLHRL